MAFPAWAQALTHDLRLRFSLIPSPANLLILIRPQLALGLFCGASDSDMPSPAQKTSLVNQRAMALEEIAKREGLKQEERFIEVMENNLLNKESWSSLGIWRVKKRAFRKVTRTTAAPRFLWQCFRSVCLKGLQNDIPICWTFQ